MGLAVRTAEIAARAESPVLIEGESGTGKELIARLVHSASGRKNGPFVAVNCGAIPETLFESELFGHIAGSFTGATRDKPGIFEAASGGVLFLDEIGDLSLPLQAKLLRVLQESELRRVGDTRTNSVDVRVVSATNRNLEEEMREKRFRDDLFFRVSVLRICVEPLRRRRADIAVLAEHFATKYAARQGREAPRFSEEALRLMGAYAWPGNVRELENEVQRVIAFSPDGRVEAEHLSDRIRHGPEADPGGRAAGSLKERLDRVERQVIRETLDRYAWNKTQAARNLGLTRQGLHRKVRRLGILRHR